MTNLSSKSSPHSWKQPVCKPDCRTVSAVVFTVFVVHLRVQPAVAGTEIKSLRSSETQQTPQS